MKKMLILFVTLIVGQTVFSQEKLTDLKLEYQAISRGSFEKMTLTKDVMFYSDDRGKKTTATVNLSEKQWDKVNRLVNQIKLKELPYLKAPSDKRKYDGAAHAKLKVFVNDKEYESSSFDHGNPPIEIKSLVEYIMTMSKSKDGN